MLLFENQTTDGESSIINHKGGPIQVQVEGTFDPGSSLLLKVRQDELSFFTLSNGVFTTADIKSYDLEIGTEYKFVVEGAVSNTNISVSVI